MQAEVRKRKDKGPRRSAAAPAGDGALRTANTREKGKVEPRGSLSSEEENSSSGEEETPADVRLDANGKGFHEKRAKQRKREKSESESAENNEGEDDDDLFDPEVIVVPRDYSSHDGANITRFRTSFPRRLRERRVKRRDWERTIEGINAHFSEAEALDCTAFMEGCFGCLTAFSLFLCYEHRYKRVLRRLDEFLAEENAAVYQHRGLELLNPLMNGLLQLEFRVLDPIDV